MTLLVLALVPLTVSLGFWQIDRGAQKRAIEDARLASYGALPVDEVHLMDAPAFSSARVEGRYDGERQFLVDNRSQRGLAGYVVVTPFDTVGGRRLLVDRGWVAAPTSRGELPDVAPPSGVVKIVGTLWAASAATNDKSVWSEGWPKRVNQFDADRMGEAVGDAIPMELRLEEDQPGSLEPILLGEEMSSTRHIGYAVQWFAMAAALVVAYVILGVRRGREQ
jgi:surfeit locus 1 family protein